MTSLSAGVLGLLSALTLISSVSGHRTVCTDIYNKTCIDAVKVVMMDRSLFWFGTGYKTACPQGPGGMGGCFNSRADFNDSLITRMMEDDDATSESLKFIINVTYTLPAERSFMGCGGMINMSNDEVTYKKIDPLSGHRVYAFDASLVPSVTWESQDGVQYTVVYYDVGSLILHGVYININGGDITLGEVALAHRGPKNTLTRKNPYVWAAFSQQAGLVLNDVTNYVKQKTASNVQFMLSEFLTRFNLTGPVGINTVRAVGDEYSAHFMRNMNVFNRCPMYLQKRLQGNVDALGGLTFNLSSAVATKSIDLQFVSKPMSFMSCCKNHNLGNVDKTFNFKQISEAMGSQTREKPTVTIVPEILADNLTGQYFTLMILDVSRDLNSSTPGAAVHWLVVNIPSKDITSGDEVLKYRPLVPMKMDQMFFVLLYKQSNRNDAVKDIAGLSGSDCPMALKDRCMFKVRTYVTNNNLMLSGVRALKVKTDMYSRHQQVKDKRMMEKDVCKGMEGYANPCPTSAANVLKSSSVLSVLILMLFLAWC